MNYHPAPTAPLSHRRPMTYHSDSNVHPPFHGNSFPGPSSAQMYPFAPPPPPPPVGHWNQPHTTAGPSRHSMGPGTTLVDSLPAYAAGSRGFNMTTDAKNMPPPVPPLPSNLNRSDSPGQSHQGNWGHHEAPSIHHRHTLAGLPSTTMHHPPPLPHKEFSMPEIHRLNDHGYSVPPPPPLPPKVLLMPTPVTQNPFSDSRSVSRVPTPHSEVGSAYFSSHSVATSPRSTFEQQISPGDGDERSDAQADPAMDELQKVLQLSAQSYETEQQRLQEMNTSADETEEEALARIMELSLREEEEHQRQQQREQALLERVMERGEEDMYQQAGPSNSRHSPPQPTERAAGSARDDEWEAYDPSAFDNQSRPSTVESHSALALQQPYTEPIITTFAPVPRHHTSHSFMQPDYSPQNTNHDPTPQYPSPPSPSTPSLSRSQSYQPTGHNRTQSGLSHSRTFSGPHNRDLQRGTEQDQHPPQPIYPASPQDEPPPPMYEQIVSNPINIPTSHQQNSTLAPPSHNHHQHPIIPRILTPSLSASPNMPGGMVWGPRDPSSASTDFSTSPVSDEPSPGGGVGGFFLPGFSASPVGLSPVMQPMSAPGGHGPGGPPSGLSPPTNPADSPPTAPSVFNSPAQADLSPGGSVVVVDPSHMSNVSYGHFPPDLSQHIVQPPLGFPSTIILHPEAAFHIRAPSWKALLILLAALGDTTLEPSPGAFQQIFIPSSQTSLSLRLVLHFNKNKYGPDWTVVLWLDLDRGLPAQDSFKFTRGDTTMLPHKHRIPEWNLGSVSQLAANSSGDITSSMSSIIYVVPTPVSGLPMPVSNLAAVLTAALMDSKKAMTLHATTAGAGSGAGSPFDPIASQRRLYKAVEKCFAPSKKKSGTVTTGVIESSSEVKIVGKRGVTRWMSSMVGGVMRPKEVKGGQHGNDDNFVELITPYTLPESNSK